MPVNKFLKNLLVEIVLCFTIATLAGHLSVNFWERYVVHKELCSMKENLHRLKITVSHIGNAYDNLQNELIDLAGAKNTKRPIPRHDVKFSCKNTDVNAAKSLRNEMIREINNENHKPIKQKERETMSVSFNEIKKGDIKNATTITNSYNTVASNSDQETYSKRRYSCKLTDMHENREHYKTCGCYFE